MTQLLRSVLHMLTIPPQNVFDAYTPEEAFAKFQHYKHDLVITDWLENPDMGIKLTEMIRKNKNSPNAYVPIIMTAGSAHYKRVVKARDAGISDYVVKPFSARLFASRITRVIEDRRPFVESEDFLGPDRRRKQDLEYDGEERREASNSTEDEA